ncbi:hypothetical protein [Cohnella thermotolerans]|uniref:hypothetical protein n=1 Tax=Cohnella thermotolerans TaxID=329858 RepID=UPI0012EB81BC|nr:hypothetical protein [Cohnella thermotolerans]
MRRTCGDHGLFRDDPDGWEAFWAAFLEHNFKHWTDFAGGGNVRSMADVLKFSFSDSLLGTPEELHEQLSGTYWNYFCGTCIFEEGAERLLSVLPDSYALGIVSNGVGEAQRRRLQAGGESKAGSGRESIFATTIEAVRSCLRVWNRSSSSRSFRR